MHFENEKLAFRRRLEKNLAGDNAKPALMQILNQEAPYEIKGEKKQNTNILYVGPKETSLDLSYSANIFHLNSCWEQLATSNNKILSPNETNDFGSGARLLSDLDNTLDVELFGQYLKENEIEICIFQPVSESICQFTLKLLLSHEKEDSQSALSKIFATLKNHKIKTMFWYWEDELEYTKYQECMENFDAFCIADKNIYDIFVSNHLHDNTIHLPIAYEPACFNPIKNLSKEDRNFATHFCSFSGVRVLSGALGESIQSKIASALSFNFGIFEPHEDVRPISPKISNHYKSAFLGCFTNRQTASYLKYTEILLLIRGGGRINRRDELTALWALSTNTVVITDLDVTGTTVAGLVVAVETSDDVGAVLQNLSINELERHKLQHFGYVNSLKSNTFFDRIRQIRQFFDLLSEDEILAAPKVSVIVPTMRLELIEFFTHCFSEQTYSNLELIVVIHGNSKLDSKHKAILERVDAKVIYASSSKTVSEVLNIGISSASGDYFARMDDDDYYAPNYFRDAILAYRFCDFSLLGKASWFVYFEGSDELVRRGIEDMMHAPNLNIAGGTFIGKLQSDVNPRFRARTQGYADLQYIYDNECSSNNLCLSLDCLNFVQIRRADTSSHTWTVKDSDYEYSVKLPLGTNIEEVLV